MKSLAFASPASRNSVRRDCSYLLAMSLILTLATASAQTDLTSEQSAQVGGMGGGSTAIAGQFIPPLGQCHPPTPSVERNLHPGELDCGTGERARLA